MTTWLSKTAAGDEPLDTVYGLLPDASVGEHAAVR
jgi:hypothetical protein